MRLLLPTIPESVIAPKTSAIPHRAARHRFCRRHLKSRPSGTRRMRSSVSASPAESGPSSPICCVFSIRSSRRLFSEPIQASWSRSCEKSTRSRDPPWRPSCLSNSFLVRRSIACHRCESRMMVRRQRSQHAVPIRKQQRIAYIEENKPTLRHESILTNAAGLVPISNIVTCGTDGDLLSSRDRAEPDDVISQALLRRALAGERESNHGIP